MITSEHTHYTYIYIYMYIHIDTDCIVFVWQGFGSRGATGVAFVRSCWKLPLCPIAPMLAGSKMDPLLAKAKPISKGGSTSVITC